MDDQRLKQALGPRGVRAAKRVRVGWRRVRRHPALLVPASRHWGLDRGTPVDRHYIEDFLLTHGGGEEPGDIRGHVLEIGNDRYAHRFGYAAGVEKLDILDINPANPSATIIGDLVDPDTLPTASFDCAILTQVLMLIYDFRAALENLHRALKPRGTLLITVSGIAGICRPEIDRHGDYWRFTSLSLQRILEEQFGTGDVTVRAYGNVRSASAFLYGLAAEELSDAELNLHDRDYEVTVAGRAVKT